MKATIRDKFAPNSSKLKTSKKLQPHPKDEHVTTTAPKVEPQPMEPEPTHHLVIPKNEPMEGNEMSNNVTSQQRLRYVLYYALITMTKNLEWFSLPLAATFKCV